MSRIEVRDPELRDWQLTPARAIGITVCLTLVLLPHALRIPLWVLGGFLVFAAWRVLNALRNTPLPPRWLVIPASLVLLGGVYATYGTLFGRNAGVALLVVLAGMKLMESRGARDAYVLGSLGFFLVITNFLFSQSITTLVYMFAVVLAMTATLISFCTGASLGHADRVRMAGAMLLQAVPIMLVLFVLFPRLPGPLWGLPRDAHSAASGLGDTMVPGQISRLILSDEVAFRVRFHGDVPAADDLYWRGPVLWRTDGRGWSAGQQSRSWRAQYAETYGDPVDYTVTMEPHGQPWLFALDVPTTIPRGAQMTRDFQIRVPKPVRERQRYEMRSYTRYRLPHLSPDEQGNALGLPFGAHQRTRELALDWRSELADDQALVSRALDYFRDQPFIYTLTPPLIDGDTIDGFLFDTRQGFCEHFSAAFTVLMRAAGIPARVVTGYQGGEMNPLGEYLIVRQRDAHAWVEVWLERTGWTRVDPTGAVSPNRIQLGMDAAIPPTIGPAGLGIEGSEEVRELWRRLRHGLDAISASWNEWVLGYGNRRQRELLALFGLDAGDLGELALGILVAVLAILALVALGLARAPRAADPALRAYRRFCRKLARAGFTRRAAEGPLDFAARVAARRPSLGEPVSRITASYVRLRYGSEPGRLGELRRAVAAFRPR
ncbi:MAG: DUF3488 and transglutaminase-like domain-containing protein [Gammaproteobacteria bacterium]|nr:DUF3488 and transglutaminase-like domain-containing protein [Gammaproteobacteria bacterium]